MHWRFGDKGEWGLMPVPGGGHSHRGCAQGLSLQAVCGRGAAHSRTHLGLASACRHTRDVHVRLGIRSRTESAFDKLCGLRHTSASLSPASSSAQ